MIWESFMEGLGGSKSQLGQWEMEAITARIPFSETLLGAQHPISIPAQSFCLRGS